MRNLKEIQKKVILIGDGAVGKTSLIRRFVVDKFDDKYLLTIGSKITAKALEINNNGDTVYLKLQIWDILGQKGYAKLHHSSFKGTDGVFLVADITRRSTLESLERYWIPEVQNIVNNVPFLILANKSDLIEKAEFDEEELRNFSSKYRVPFYLTSAKSGDNVNRAFEVLGSRMIRHKVHESTRSSRPQIMAGEKREIDSVIDRIIDDFCKEYGELEDAMPILRKQFELADLDLNSPKKEALTLAIENLANIEKGFKNEKVAEKNKQRRLRWVNEIRRI